MDPPQKPGVGRFPSVKITALTRWKTLRDTIKSRQRNTNIIFPPPSWEIDKLVIDGNNNGWEQTHVEPPLKTPSSGEETVAQPNENVESAEPEDDARALTFAQRIRDLIETLPFPGVLPPSRQPTTTDGGGDTDKMPDTAVSSRAEDGSIGPPVPPGVDQELIFMLSSEEVMNGDEKEGEGLEKQGGTQRQSVWNILSSMKWKGKGKEKEPETDAEQPTTTATDSSDTPLRFPTTQSHIQDGIMMYAPLVPANDSQVQLAEVCSLLGDDTSGSSAHPRSPVLEQPDENIAWVPSTTQISVFTTWWGYRLYLPPAVMSTLDSVSVTATTQAAMVTGALKWLLNKVPEMFVPPQFKPALVLLKRLAPVVGYIGVFVAWSWGRIKKYDKGNGVVLTATWLLPVALIPMAWDAGDIHGPILLPKPEDRVPPPSLENDEGDQARGKKKRFWFR